MLDKFRKAIAGTLEWLSISRFIPLEKRKSYMNAALPIIFMIVWFPVLSLIYSAALQWVLSSFLSLTMPGLVYIGLACLLSVFTLFMIQNALRNSFRTEVGSQDMNVENFNN
jgi:polyferredoxin